MVVCRKDGSHFASQSIYPQMVESTHLVAIVMVREDWISTAKLAFRELSAQQSYLARSRTSIEAVRELSSLQTLKRRNTKEAGHCRSSDRLGRKPLDSAKLLVCPLNVRFGKIEECPVAISCAHLRQHRLQYGFAVCPTCLRICNRLTKKYEVIAKRSPIRCVSHFFAMARNELRRRILAHQRVKSVDPLLGRCVNEIGQRVVPEEVATENYIRLRIVDDRITASMTWHHPQRQTTVVSDVYRRALRVGHVRKVKLFHRRSLLRRDLRAEELQVLCPLPYADVFLCHHRGSRLGEDRISGHVVQVIVRVHNVPHGQLCLLVVSLKHLFRRRRVLERVNDQHTLGPDHEACVRPGLISFCCRVVDRRPCSVPQLLQHKGWLGLAQGAGAQKSGHHGCC